MRKKFGKLFKFIFRNIWVNISRVWLKRRMRKELKHAKSDGEDKTNLASVEKLKEYHNSAEVLCQKESQFTNKFKNWCFNLQLNLPKNLMV